MSRVRASVAKRASVSWRKVFLSPVTGAISWSTVGIAGGVFLPGYLADAGLIASAPIVTTTLCGGALFILAPIGGARGALSATHDLAVPAAADIGRVAYHNAVSSGGASKIKDASWLKETLKDAVAHGGIVGEITAGSGIRGTIGRLLLSPFLPSTAMMLERVEEGLTLQLQLGGGSRAGDADIVAAASAGFVEGFIEDKKVGANHFPNCSWFHPAAYAVLIIAFSILGYCDHAWSVSFYAGRS